MSITYTYEIISVDQASRCMEVIYTSEGNPTMHIGARLPYEGETVEAIVRMYAPVPYWEERKTPIVPVDVGQSGAIVVPPHYVPTTAALAVARRNALLAESDYTQLADVPLTAEMKVQWATYRQQLRDITDQPGFPDAINWPALHGIPVTVA
jgi:hypothetical protein